MHRFFFASLLSLLASAQAVAIEVEGVKLADTVEVGGRELTLNGAGVRSRFFFDIYVGALYVERRVGSGERVLALSGPKRVLLHFLYSEVEREKLVEAWNDGFESNLNRRERQALHDRIALFNSFFETVRRGDEITIDYVPDDGTTVAYNGEPRGTVGGEDFAKAWLKIFIGPTPADDDLKAALLGG